MPHGGKRNGTPGRSYPQRSDLQAQPVRAVPNQTYGQAGQQRAAQQQIPLPQQAPPGTGQPPPAGAVPGQHGPINAPTNQPNQPLTAGLPTGPGPGPEALAQPGGQDTTLTGTLRGLYHMYPNSDLRNLIATLDARGPSRESAPLVSGSRPTPPPGTPV